MAIQTISYSIEYWNGSAWTALNASAILDADPQIDTSGTGTGFAFGDAVDATATLRTWGDQWATLAFDTPVRFRFTSGSTATAFTGIVAERERDDATCTFQLVSIARRISTTRAYSPLFVGRPVATLTTAASVEDPSSGSYQAGLINWLLWQAGGRPLAQAGTYPSAVFYYACDQALFAPAYTWAAGEDSWAECGKLAAATGGQLRVAADGTVRYVQPLTFAGGSSVASYGSSDIAEGIQETIDARQYATAVSCPYLPRAARPIQTVIEETTPRLVGAGATETIELQPQWPLASVVTDGGNVPEAAMVVTLLDGRTATLTTHYTRTLTTAAQRLIISVTAGSLPVIVQRITISGSPVTAGEGGVVSAGSGTPIRTIQDNPYIQSRSHAQRLANLSLAFYGTLRPRRTLPSIPYDPALAVGDVVTLTISEWSLSSVAHVVVSIRHRETGALMDLDVVEIAGLPVSGDYFQWGSTNYSGQTLDLVW